MWRRRLEAAEPLFSRRSDLEPASPLGQTYFFRDLRLPVRVRGCAITECTRALYQAGGIAVCEDALTLALFADAETGTLGAWCCPAARWAGEAAGETVYVH